MRGQRLAAPKVPGIMKVMQPESRTLAEISSDNAATSIHAVICLGFGTRMSLSSRSHAELPIRSHARGRARRTSFHWGSRTSDRSSKFVH
jgi:hypothetical protein